MSSLGRSLLGKNPPHFLHNGFDLNQNVIRVHMRLTGRHLYSVKQYIFKHEINTIIKCIVLQDSMLQTCCSVFKKKRRFKCRVVRGEGSISCWQVEWKMLGRNWSGDDMSGSKDSQEAPGTLVAWAPCQSPRITISHGNTVHKSGVFPLCSTKQLSA